MLFSKISIASDHAGVHYKEGIISYLKKKYPTLTVSDLGPYTEERVDYPDYAHPLALSVENGECEAGIILCGSGNGVCMSVNKHKSIRGALCWEVEIATLARLHNNANVLCMPARFVSLEKAIDISEAFLNTEFEGGRHKKRIDKI
ncbi:MAG: ribose 5-phosphate isomerase B [Bacteroidales bacterium]|nr:ribose 5-phosphate isomerase B [Bacteroidales bacterium]